MICWSQKYYICNKCNKCFNLRYHLVHLLPIYLFRIMTVRDEKMFLTVSRDLSTDRHQKDPKPLSHSTLSDKSPITNKFNQNSSNGPMRTFLTFCQFPDLPIEFCENGCPKPLWFHIKNPEKRSKWMLFEPVWNGRMRKVFEHSHWC